MNNREIIEAIWHAGVARVGGEGAVKTALENSDILRIDGIIAVGKAAGDMMASAIAWMKNTNQPEPKALLITKYHHAENRHDFGSNTRVIEAGHPVPDENSLIAGAALMEFVAEMGPHENLLVLVSGGASAVTEVLADDISLAQLQARTDAQIAAGLPIAEINAQRRAISKIKDGKLLANFHGSQVQVMAISDVEGDELSVIGSGIGMIDRVEHSIQANCLIVACNQLAREECERSAAGYGLSVICNNEDAYGDVDDVANAISDALTSGPAGVYIWGGEPTVVLPENPGRGGRNQHLALLLARKLNDHPGIEIIVGGTDGTDGPTEAAGGFITTGKIENMEKLNDALVRADAGNYLGECGDLFVTGPTGTNVMDLIVAIKIN